MNCRKSTLSVIGFAVCACVSVSARSANKETNPDPVTAAVEKTLRRETIAQLDRRVELKDLLAQHSDSSAARWQTGFVRNGKGWRSFDEYVPSGATGNKLARYCERRDQTPQTAAGQLDLANWCRRHSLPAQERTHLFAVLNLSPAADNSQVLRRLGHRRVGSFWLSRDEIEEWEQSNKSTETSLKLWSPRINNLASGLSGSRSKHDAALTELKRIDDPAAIPALEMAAVDQTSENAIELLQLVARHRTYTASIALARQAVFAKAAEVRNAATGFLKTQKVDDFVPALIHLLAMPADFQPLQIQFPSRGVLFFGCVISRETESEVQVAQLRSICRLLPVYAGTVRARGNPDIIAAIQQQNSDEFQRRYDLASLELENEQRRVEVAVSRQNEQTKVLNTRVTAVLSAIAGDSDIPTDDPRGWWSWWHSYSDVQPTSQKRVIRIEETDEKRVAVPTIELIPASCFAAGTLVQTASGLSVIDQIKPGDLVIAQDTNTGELALKPVIQTSVRPAKGLVRLRIGDETLLATGGHRFWVSGEGWVKARDLKPQMLIHTITGNAPVWSVEKGTTEETYNLVVDDFHSYFVGRTGLFVQDLPLPRPTDCVVPGLPRKRLVATSSP